METCTLLKCFYLFAYWLLAYGMFMKYDKLLWIYGLEQQLRVDFAHFPGEDVRENSFLNSNIMLVRRGHSSKRGPGFRP